MNLFQTCLNGDEQGAAGLVKDMIKKAKPIAVWSVLMHAAAWHEQKTFDTPHSTIMTYAIHRMTEDLGFYERVLSERPENSPVQVPRELQKPLQRTLLQRLGQHIAAVDHWDRESGPSYSIDKKMDSPGNLLRTYVQAVRQHSHMGAYKAAFNLTNHNEFLRLFRLTSTMAAENPDGLGHGFIMPLSLLTELPRPKFTLPHKAVLWHLAEYLVRKIPDKEPRGFSTSTDFKDMTTPTDISSHSGLLATALVEYGILGHNGIFAHRIAEAARRGIIEQSVVDWLIQHLEKNVGGCVLTKEELEVSHLIEEGSGTDWDEKPTQLDLPDANKVRAWLSENSYGYWEKMMDLKASTFEEVIPDISPDEWPIVRAAQYAMSTINGASRASHITIFTQSAWNLSDKKLISKAFAAIQVHRMLREYLDGR